MKRLLVFELRKIWYKRIWMVPVLFLAVLVTWGLVGGGFTLVKRYYSMDYMRYEASTRSYWGRQVTETVKEKARGDLRRLGAKEDSSGYFDVNPIIQEYGSGSVEYDLANFWTIFVLQSPTLEEAQAEYKIQLESIEMQYPEGKEKELALHRFRRQGGPAVQEIVPGMSGWRFWLDSQSYLQLLSGVATLGLILLLVGDLFSREEGGGLREISLATPNARKWILSKILAALITGGGIAFALYGASLLTMGLLFGFQGWNCNPLGYVMGGYAFGVTAYSGTCLTLALTRLVLITLGGAAMALLVGGCSALLRQTLAAAGLTLGLCFGMESLLYIVGNVEMRWGLTSNPLWNRVDWDLLKAVCTTPVRLFLNPEIFTWRFPMLQSAYDNVLIYNLSITPELLLAFVGTLLLGAALCAAACFTYRRQH